MPPRLVTGPRAPLAQALLAGAALYLAGCAAPRTQVGQVSRDALLEEQVAQQRYVLETQLKQQARLQAVGYPLLRGAVSLCGQDATRRMGVLYANAPSFGKAFRDAARSLGFSDTVSVTQVLPGSGAERAGLRPGDRLLEIDGTMVAAGGTAVRDLGAWLARREKGAPEEYRVTYRRDGTPRTVAVPADPVCGYGLVALRSDELNAFADGRNVYVTTAMLRFAADDAELATVLGHEIAHNAMRHVDAKLRNQGLGMLLGAIVDVAAAANGVNTQGEFTNQFGKLGGMVFSQDFEREADYVGMYVLALSGRPVHDAAELWRHMAAENPGAIRFATSHPTTAERFVRLRQYADEIERKQSTGLALAPEMRTPFTAAMPDPGGEVLTAAGKRASARQTAAAPPPEPLAGALAEDATADPPTPRQAPAPTPPGVRRWSGTDVDTAASPVTVQLSVRVPGLVVGTFRYVPDYPVLVVGPGSASALVRTDETGTATLTLVPGRYRIVPYRSDAVATRQRYEWNLPLDVTPGMQPVELTEENGRRKR